MPIHEHSLEAWWAFQPKASKRMLQIMNEIIKNGPGTDRQLLLRLKRRDMNEVRPTITLLIQKEFLKEIGSTTDKHTKRTVRIVHLETRKKPIRNIAKAEAERSKKCYYCKKPLDRHVKRHCINVCRDMLAELKDERNDMQKHMLQLSNNSY